MPLFFQQQVNRHTQLAIWKIEEEERFFRVPLQRSITHPHKRLQHLAGRYLLSYLFPGFPTELIKIADTRKPFLEDELFHFSIAHCGDYAAAIVSTENRVGMDIELVTNKIQRIQHKFVSEAEMKKVSSQWSLEDCTVENKNHKLSTINCQLTLVWSCKEAVFKWYGLGEVDFKKNMQVNSVEKADKHLFQTAILFNKTEDRLLSLQSRFYDGLWLSYVVT